MAWSIDALVSAVPVAPLRYIFSAGFSEYLRAILPMCSLCADVLPLTLPLDIRCKDLSLSQISVEESGHAPAHHEMKRLTIIMALLAVTSVDETRRLHGEILPHPRHWRARSYCARLKPEGARVQREALRRAVVSGVHLQDTEHPHLASGKGGGCGLMFAGTGPKEACRPGTKI